MSKELEDLVDLIFDTDMEEVIKEKSTLEYIHKLQQENKQLKKDKKKAIEWVKKNQYYFPRPTELLEILGDKE